MTTKTTSDAETADDENLQDEGTTRQAERKPERTERKPASPPRDEDLPDDPDALKEEVRRLKALNAKTNKENAERRRRADELERAEEERKNATLGETERLKKERAAEREKREEAERRAAAAEERLANQRIDLEVERLAAKMGFLYPDIVPSLINRNRIEEDEETGKLHGIKEELERLAKDRPALVEAPRGGGTPPREGPRRTATDMRGREQPRGNPFEDDLRGSGKYSV